MRTQETKTIDIKFYGWYDSENTKNYFAGIITINKGMESEEVVKMPMQLGYKHQYEELAYKLLYDRGFIEEEKPYGKIVYVNTNEASSKSQLENL